MAWENRLVQGFERADRQLLDTEALAGHLVPRTACSRSWPRTGPRCSPTAITRTCSRRPVRPPVGAGYRIAAVMTLQTLHDFSDRETAEAVKFDVRWKVACGLALDDAGFDPSTLVYWRRRIARSGRPHRINNAVRTVVEQTGILKGRRRRAVDSTILADGVATQDTVTQLVSRDPAVGARGTRRGGADRGGMHRPRLLGKPGKPKIDWDDPAAKDALVSALVNDATALVAAFSEAKLDEQAASAVALLALVAGQDVEPADGSDGTDGRWRIARKVGEDRVSS